MVSLVLPTYNEANNIEPVLRRSAAALGSTEEDFEIIVVDDGSADGTAERAEALQSELPVRVLRRGGRLGLATAVVDGWRLARGELLAVMDADLQHPPEVLAAMILASREPEMDLVIASRRVPGGKMECMPLVRQWGSVWSTAVAAALLPCSVGGVRDPLSGMFLIRRQALEGAQLDPTGYKILLEVLAKARYRKLAEVPMVFDRRGSGASKLGSRQAIEYFQHLWQLAGSSGEQEVWVRYLAAGTAGAVVNLSALFIAAAMYEWPAAAAVPFSIQVALFATYFLHHRWTFRGRRGEPAVPPTARSRFWRYETLCLPGAILNAFCTLLLNGMGMALLAAAGCGILIAHLFHFFLRVPSIWRIWRTSVR